MTRLAEMSRVVFWEEVVEIDGGDVRLVTRIDPKCGVVVATPHLPKGLSANEIVDSLRRLLDQFVADESSQLILWYYTPMMLPFSKHLSADCTVYDCMDELANFKFAPPELLSLETDLLARADLVFTGGHSLYEAKRSRHARVFAFPSSVDTQHFAAARNGPIAPADQADLPHPRLGYCGVIDERLDLGLIAAIADAHPQWSIIMVGPVVKIGEDELPRRANIHYLGSKSYDDLPAYLGGWDVALMPFALNEATRFISPTKTPEYLAAGLPVVSTSITDVVRHYAELAAVTIADGAKDFVSAAEEALSHAGSRGKRLAESDAFLATMNWSVTVDRMWALIAAQLEKRQKSNAVFSPDGLGHANTGYDVMVVGAGFAGAVMAERLASQGKRVLVVDRRPHIAGNAYDRFDDAGLLIHQYGPHIFHTNSAEIFEYLSQFTTWRFYEHRVLAKVGDLLVPVPINRTTLNILYGLKLSTDADAEAFLAARAEPMPVVETSEDVVVGAVGRELYEMFFKGYTQKQWGLDPSQLDKSVTARVPTRTNTDDRYFSDRFQFIPADGYTKMFERMLDHPNIELLLGVDYQQVHAAYGHDHLVFTGPIDEYFGYRFGKLPYRSLRFEHETLDQELLQPVAVVNYPDIATPYTRITEYKHLTGQQHAQTSITREYPSAEGDPYYPVPRPENQALFKRYEALALAENDVTFVGRLATYRYYNMDQIVGQALAVFRRKFSESALLEPAERRVATSA